MKALIWKEARETVWLWLAGLLVMVMVGALDLKLNWHEETYQHLGDLFLPCWVALTLIAPLILSARTLARENRGGLLLLGSLPVTSGQILAAKRLVALLALVSLLPITFLVFPAELAIQGQHAVVPALQHLIHSLDLVGVEFCLVGAAALLIFGFALSGAMRSQVAAALVALVVAALFWAFYILTVLAFLVPWWAPRLGALRSGLADVPHALCGLGVLLAAALVSMRVYSTMPILAVRPRLKRSAALFGAIVLAGVLLGTLVIRCLPYLPRPVSLGQAQLDPTGQWLALTGGEAGGGWLSPCGVWTMKTDGSHLALLSRGPAEARGFDSAGEHLTLMVGGGDPDDQPDMPLAWTAERSGDQWRLKWTHANVDSFSPKGTYTLVSLATEGFAVDRERRFVRRLPQFYVECGWSGDEGTVYACRLVERDQVPGGPGGSGLKSGPPPVETHVKALTLATGAVRDVGTFPGEVTVKVSPDGRWLALSQLGPQAEHPRRAISLTLLDPGTGVQHVFPGLEASAWSPDSRYLWCGALAPGEAQNGVHILDAQSLREIRAFSLPAAEWRGHWSVQFSPQGELAAITVSRKLTPDPERSRTYLCLARGDGSGLRTLGELRYAPQRWIADDQVLGWTGDRELMLLNPEVGTISRLNVQTRARRVIYPQGG
jgi:hypothetical protein